MKLLHMSNKKRHDRFNPAIIYSLTRRPDYLHGMVPQLVPMVHSPRIIIIIMEAEARFKPGIDRMVYLLPENAKKKVKKRM